MGIDASRAARAKRTGTETYALEMIKALASQSGPQLRLRLYTPHLPRHDDWPRSPYVETCVIPLPRLWSHVRLATELYRHRPDVLFVPAHVVPFTCPVPAIVTVHDLGYHHFPQAHRLADRYYLAWSTRRHTRVARHIIADSQATKDDLVNLYGADPDYITVVYLGQNKGLAPEKNLQKIAQVKQRYYISGDYVLYIGTLQPRKNLARLIEGYQLALQRLPKAQQTTKLVIAGQKGWLYDEIFARVQELGLTEQVLFPGFVADGDKAALLTGAVAYVFPSLYEGFGLPLLEAMACNTPILTSNTSSLPEVAGDAALLVDPLDVQAIAGGLIRLITDVALRQDLVEKGYYQLKKFSWEHAATQVVEIVEQIL